MVLEATGDMQYVLPLMLTVLTACWIGNLFTEGIYDMTIHLRRLGYLDEEESVARLVELHDVTLADAMTRRPYYMLPVMRVGEYYDILAKAKHHCFPVGTLRCFSYCAGYILMLHTCSCRCSGIGQFERAGRRHPSQNAVHSIETQGLPSGHRRHLAHQQCGRRVPSPRAAGRLDGAGKHPPALPGPRRAQPQRRGQVIHVDILQSNVALS
jgi:hypothetical protein